MGLKDVLSFLLGRKVEEISCTPGVAFPWPKGLRLQACEDLQVLLPGGVLSDEVALGAIIDLPDNVAVGFDKSSDGQSIEAIRIALKRNDAMTLNRSAQAMVVAEDGLPKKFRILKRPG